MCVARRAGPSSTVPDGDTEAQVIALFFLVLHQALPKSLTKLAKSTTIVLIDDTGIRLAIIGINFVR